MSFSPQFLLNQIAKFTLISLVATLTVGIAPDNDVKTTRGKLTLIGIDAGDYYSINHLRARGMLPTFDKLMRQGASGSLESIYPMFSPIVWTTIATGMSPIEHGIRGFKLFQPAINRKMSTNAAFRQTKAVWEILTDGGIESLIVAWFNSWPADKVAGIMVSDYVFQLKSLKQWKAFVTDELRTAFKFQTYPQNILGKLKRYLIDRKAPNAELEKRFDVKVSEAPFALRHSFAKDTTYFNIFRNVRKSREFDFHSLYFQGPDLLGHKFMSEFSLWKKDKLKPGTDTYRKGNYTAAYYQYIDDLLKEYIEEIRAPNETLLIVSDHGFEDKGTPVLTKVSDVNFSKRRFWHRKHGLIIAHGPAVKPGKILGADVFDITPTILAHFGLPVAKNMRGEPIERIVPRPYKTIKHYDNLENYGADRSYAKFLFNKVKGLGFTQSRK